MTAPPSPQVTIHDPRIAEFSPSELRSRGLTGWARLPGGGIILQSDPVGSRPFCYRIIDGTVHLACYPGDLARLDPQSSPDLTTVGGLTRFHFPDDGASAFTGVHRVLGGTEVRMAASGDLRVARWWQLLPEGPGIDAPDLWSALVAECRRIVAGRTVAVMLSGGLDSSAIAAATVQAVREAGWPDPLMASLVYPGLPNDEDAWQESAARHLGVARVTVDPVGQSVWTAAVKVVRERWTPMADTQSGAIGQLFRLAHDRGAEAMLSGFGGDVLFRGLGLELDLARRGKLLAVHRYFRQLAQAMPVSGPRLWYSGVVRPLILGARAPGMDDADITSAGSSVRSYLVQALKQPAQAWLIEAVEQAAADPMALESPFYGFGFLQAFSRLTHHTFAASRSHKGVLREMIRPHLPEFVVGRVRKSNFLDYHRTWLDLDRESLRSRYRELRPRAPDSLGLPADIGEALNATTGPDGFSRSWMALTALEFLAAQNFLPLS